ncbi:MAG: ABC transporter permease [Lentisphaerae bacterium]|nr:ABC transporter permease [Lentisphaerota bacterium]
MLNYILRRTFYSLWVIAGVLVLTFLLFNLSAGDPAAAVLGKNALPEEIENFRRSIGGDLPLFYGKFCRTEAFEKWKNTPQTAVTLPKKFDCRSLEAKITLDDRTVYFQKIPDGSKSVEFSAPQGKKIAEIEVFRVQDSPWNSQLKRALDEIISFKSTFPYITIFNFGSTLLSREPISEVLLRGMGPSLSLMLPIFAGEIIFGIIFALTATAFAGTLTDRIITLLSIASMSVSYLAAIIFGQWILGYQLELFPVWGFDGVANYGLPVLIGILCGTGSNIRFFRTVFLDELRREYLRTAAAKGCSTAAFYGKHLLRNSLIQIITRISAGLPFLFTGSLLLESFFGIPGLGFAGIEALNTSDIQLLKALVLLSALLFVIMNLLADIAYAWVDPRIKLE